VADLNPVARTGNCDAHDILLISFYGLFDTELGIIMAVDIAYWSTLFFVLFSMRASVNKRARLGN